MRNRFFVPVILVLIAVFSAQCKHLTGGAKLKNSGIPLSVLIDSLGTEPHDIHVLIDKSDYILSILANETLIKEYAVVFGGNPKDDKRMEGDECTPEGTFRMVSKYPHKRWNKFIWLNYPTDDSWAKHRKAKQEGSIPPDARIGGEIGIHGVPEGLDLLIELGQNWTLGCISMKNSEVDEIYPYILEGTDIIIRK